MPLFADQHLGEQVARLKREVMPIGLFVVEGEVVIMHDIIVPDGIEVLVEDSGELLVL